MNKKETMRISDSCIEYDCSDYPYAEFKNKTTLHASEISAYTSSFLPPALLTKQGNIFFVSKAYEGELVSLFSEKWNEFIEDYYTFDACLDDLFQATNLREKINVLDTIISGYKLYEAYLMASKMPYNLQMEMFKEIIDIMNIGEYERDKAEGIYLALLSNENGFRNHIEITVLPTEDYVVGMFWTHLLAACDGIVDYSYIENLLNYHVAYLEALGTSVQCFVDDDILEDVTINYCGEVHALLNRYIEAKTL